MMKRAQLVFASAIAVISQAACDGGQATGTTPTPEITHQAPRPPSVATVDLTEAQQNAIKVEPVGTYPFFVEREAVGSVGFDEDLPIVQAESALIGTAATYAHTRKELLRLQGLGEANGIAQKEIDQAIADTQTAAAALRAARDAVRTLGKTDAQIDHVIATGRYGPDSARDSSKWVVANIAESDSPLVRVGQAVTVKLTAYPGRVYPGTVARIYATVDPDTHRVTARAQVSDSKSELRPGMLADMTIRISSPVDSPAVPTTAVVREGDGTMIA